jgi:hypothetical protein
MLGHPCADPKTTQIRTLVSIKRLQAVHASSHSGARLERPTEISPPTFDDVAVSGELLSLAAEAAEEDGE